MNETIAITAVKPRPCASKAARPAQSAKKAVTLREYIVEIVSDSGEGAQRCGQTFGAIASKMGNGVWTEEMVTGKGESQRSGTSLIGAGAAAATSDAARRRTDFRRDNLLGPDTVAHLRGDRSEDLPAALCAFAGVADDLDDVLA